MWNTLDVNLIQPFYFHFFLYILRIFKSIELTLFVKMEFFSEFHSISVRIHLKILKTILEYSNLQSTFERFKYKQYSTFIKNSDFQHRSRSGDRNTYYGLPNIFFISNKNNHFTSNDN